jgi:hypothetical protein
MTIRWRGSAIGLVVRSDGPARGTMPVRLRLFDPHPMPALPAVFKLQAVGHVAAVGTARARLGRNDLQGDAVLTACWDAHRVLLTGPDRKQQARPSRHQGERAGGHGPLRCGTWAAVARSSSLTPEDGMRRARVSSVCGALPSLPSVKRPRTCLIVLLHGNLESRSGHALDGSRARSRLLIFGIKRR